MIEISVKKALTLSERMLHVDVWLDSKYAFYFFVHNSDK